MIARTDAATAAWNPAVTVTSPDTTRSQVPVPPHGPPQPVNADPSSCVAVSLTGCPASTATEQVSEQFNPAPVTRPPPVTWTVNRGRSVTWMLRDAAAVPPPASVAVALTWYVPAVV